MLQRARAGVTAGSMQVSVDLIGLDDSGVSVPCAEASLATEMRLVLADGSIDYPRWEELIDVYVDAGVHGLVLGAGTGQHAVQFSAALPGLTWLPTDLPDALPGLQARIRAEGGASLLPAQALDVLDATAWPDGPFQAAYSANTAHIMPWAAVAAMFEGVVPPWRREAEEAAGDPGRWFINYM